jgi:hypothetical protein
MPAFAQNEDLNLWTSAGIEKKLSRRFSIALSEELRLKENISQFDMTYTNLGVKFKLSKKIRLSLYYRFIQKQRLDESMSFRHRIYGDVSFHFKFNRFLIVDRIRYQAQVKDYYSSEFGSLPEDNLRNRLELKYDIKKKPIMPYIGGEIAYQFMNPAKPEQADQLNLARIFTGLEFTILDNHSLDLFYMVQQELNVKKPMRDYVIGLSYGFKF